MPAGLVRSFGASVGMLILLASPSSAQVPAQPPSGAAAPLSVMLSGRIERAGAVDLASLQGMPPITIAMARTTPQGSRTTTYTGVLLWTLLSQAGLVPEAGPHSHLRHTLMAQGRDGYIVALAIAELDPDFEGKQVLIAYAQDGKPLPDLRLLVPADAKAGRSVRDLVAIDVR